jgi:hypothetical protein
LDEREASRGILAQMGALQQVHKNRMNRVRKCSKMKWFVGRVAQLGEHLLCKQDQI